MKIIVQYEFILRILEHEKDKRYIDKISIYNSAIQNHRKLQKVLIIKCNYFHKVSKSDISIVLLSSQEYLKYSKKLVLNQQRKLEPCIRFPWESPFGKLESILISNQSSERWNRVDTQKMSSSWYWTVVGILWAYHHLPRKWMLRNAGRAKWIYETIFAMFAKHLPSVTSILGNERVAERK